MSLFVSIVKRSLISAVLSRSLPPLPLCASLQCYANFQINISNSELLLHSSYSVRLKLLYYVVAKTEMSKNLIKIAKVNFASTATKQQQQQELKEA